MKTTLNKIKAFEPCKDGWKKLLSSLNKTEADDEELSLITILESNGLNDALFALRAVDGFEKEKRLMACDFAESVVHLANDERCVNAIKVSRNYANGIATKEELKNAWAAVASARSAARAAMTDAAWAAVDAADAAAWVNKPGSKWKNMPELMRAVCLEQERQIEIFKKYVKINNNGNNKNRK